MDVVKSKILSKISKKVMSMVSPERNLGIGLGKDGDNILAERHE